MTGSHLILVDKTVFYKFEILIQLETGLVNTLWLH